MTASIKWTQYFVANGKFNPALYSVLLYDDHITHTMHLEALKYLNANKTFAVGIPSHSSHLFNVGDVTVFSKLKGSIRRKQTEYARTINRNVTFRDFPYLFKMAWDDTVSQSSIITTFKS